MGGRAVIGFMSGNQQRPDIMGEVFVRALTDMLDAREIAATGGPRRLAEATRWDERQV
jgi:hypothetical protein